MKANEWLKAKLAEEYGDKADAVFSAVITGFHCRGVRFSSPEAQAKFEAILKEWNRLDDEPVEDHDAGQYEASSSAPKFEGDPLAEYRRGTQMSDIERAMYVRNCQK